MPEKKMLPRIEIQGLACESCALKRSVSWSHPEQGVIRTYTGAFPRHFAAQ
jgi:hypothetical protein